ncbi:ATP-binding cassette domain-containing protein [Paenibacillus sp. Marseille-Q4541]|uniref:ABC transporter ATP-binding protein n=1 Tax=Paenibacillus sp. Marseille-Q4541 TaxID=2831522 RepID=UPI001BA5DC0D|nr:ATP-binding cassette domain-containing protein [Paenibacillus sp. Marseille-Q4541]
MQLEGVNLGYRYGEQWTLRHQNITLGSGEVVGLRGPSGAGKTTLARILAGYIKPEEGHVLLNGQPMKDKGYAPVQLVFQHPERAVNPRWSMRKVLSEAGGLDDSFLEELGIQEEWLNRKPGELSGGELQRFCVARAFGKETEFLIADEMTTMLDAVTQVQIWQAVMNRAKQLDTGILIVSHEDALLQRLCTRIIDWHRFI